MSRIAPPALLLILTIGVFWKISLTRQYTWLNSPDHVNQILPWMQEEARQFRAGHFPVWDMHHWGGQSLIGQDQPGVLFPLNWLLWTMPLENGQISLKFANWYFVLIHYFAALFCYLLARDLGLGAFASVCAGASFGLSGFMGNVDWPQMLNGGMWAPLVLLFAVRSLHGARPLLHMAVAGSIEGFSMWGGHHQLPTFTLLAVGFLLLFYALFRELRWRAAAVLGLVCLVFTILAGAPQLLPSVEYWSRGLRWVGAENPVGWHDKVPYVVFNLFSLNPVSLLNLVLPAWQPMGPPFVGVTILAFALFAVVADWRARIVPPLGALAVGAAIFSLGRFSMFHGVLYSVLPLVDKSRSAAFAVFLVDLALSVLAGFGIDCLLARREDLRAQLRAFGNILLIAGALLFLLLIARGVFAGNKMLDYPAFAFPALSALLLGSALHAWRLARIRAGMMMVVILVLALFDIGSVTGQRYPHREQKWGFVDQLSAHDDLAAYLRSQPGLFRIDKNSEDIPYNFGDWYDLDEFRGYAGVTTNIITIAGAPSVREMIGTAYYLARAPHDSESEPVFRGRSGVNIYRIPGAFPRAWSVHSARVISASSRSDQFDVSRDRLASSTFLTEPAPALDNCQARDAVRPGQVGVTEFVVEADMACKGMVVIANTFFPGWHAEVDGTSQPIYEAYTFLQGVVVDRGHHRIRLWYRPTALILGLSLAGLACVALISLTRTRVPFSAYPVL
ncbi:MAG: hypothetical protein ABSB86_03980 [Bryobacteraceae bacterium]